MDSSRFDAFARSMDSHLTRRLLGRIAVVGALTSIAVLEAAEPSAEAKQRRVRSEHNIRGNKAIMCISGKTRRVAKSKRKTYLKRGATRGKCKICTPVCTVCGEPDGCGGTCLVCTANEICVNGACKACTLTCDASADVCGAALKAELLKGGTIYLCPGAYEGTFDPQFSAQIYGAGGSTDDPEVSTLLVGSDGIGAMWVHAGIKLLLSGVRVTGANSNASGGGILVHHSQAEVTIQHSVITRNRSGSNRGGGIAILLGTVSISDSEISSNYAGISGGGILNRGTLSITTTTIIDNEAADWGGGIYNTEGTTSLASTVSVTENRANNVVGSGGGIYRDSGAVNVNGASVTLNTPDQCVGVACP